MVLLARRLRPAPLSSLRRSGWLGRAKDSGWSGNSWTSRYAAQRLLSRARELARRPASAPFTVRDDSANAAHGAAQPARGRSNTRPGWRAADIVGSASREHAITDRAGRNLLARGPLASEC